MGALSRHYTHLLAKRYSTRRRQPRHEARHVKPCRCGSGALTYQGRLCVVCIQEARAEALVERAR